MNYPELEELTSIIKDTCPQQGFGSGTLDIWLDALEPYSLADCQQALKAILTEQVNPYTVPLGALLDAVQRVTAERADHMDWPEPPDGLSVERYLDWKRDESAARTTGDQRSFLQRWYGDTDVLAIEARRTGRPDPRVPALEGGQPVIGPDRLYHGHRLPDHISSIPEADAWIAERWKERAAQADAEAEASRREQVQALLGRIEQQTTLPEEEPEW